MNTLFKMILSLLVAVSFCSCSVEMLPPGGGYSGGGGYQLPIRQPSYRPISTVRTRPEINYGGTNYRRPNYVVPYNSYGNNFGTTTRNYVPPGRNSIGWDEYNARVHGN